MYLDNIYYFRLEYRKMLRKFFNSMIIITILSGLKISMTEAYTFTCNQNTSSIGFSLLSTFHSAWNSTLNCTLSQCHVSSNDSCRLSPTPCFDYRSVDDQSFCAPASLCSILESCDNITNTCSSNTSICIVNSCCQPRKVCLPLMFTQLCSSIGIMLDSLHYLK